MSVGSVNFGYDARGNLTSDGTNSYVYNSENLMTGGPNGAIFKYDALGRLQASYGTGAPFATRYEYDGADLITEFDAPSTILRRYVHGPGIDNPITWYEGSAISSTTRRFLMADERGSVVSITDSAGATIAINSYDEYGIPAPGNVGRFGYTGQTWLPEVGMWYYKARLYSPTLGRFMQTDPIGYADGMNWYNYVGSDSINGVDPFGYCQLEAWAHVQYKTRDGIRYIDMILYTYHNLSTDCVSIHGGNVGGDIVMDQKDAPDGLDGIVVTAQKEKSLIGVSIDFNLPYPIEQMWFVRSNGILVHLPTKSSKHIDKCGNVLGKNVPDPSVPLPNDVIALIHTHPRWGLVWPAAGDYTSAQSYDVYNINPSGAWVLRKGAARGSTPSALSGGTPKPPPSGNGASCNL